MHTHKHIAHEQQESKGIKNPELLKEKQRRREEAERKAQASGPTKDLKVTSPHLLPHIRYPLTLITPHLNYPLTLSPSLLPHLHYPHTLSYIQWDD